MFCNASCQKSVFDLSVLPFLHPSQPNSSKHLPLLLHCPLSSPFQGGLVPTVKGTDNLYFAQSHGWSSHVIMSSLKYFLFLVYVTLDWSMFFVFSWPLSLLLPSLLFRLLFFHLNFECWTIQGPCCWISPLLLLSPQVISSILWL